MKTSYCVSISVLTLATLITAIPCTTDPPTSLVTSVLETTSTSEATTSTIVDMTIAITNLYGTQLSLSFGVDSGFPTPLGDPQPTILPDASSTQYVYPTGWAGRMTIGPDLNPNSSKIEGSYTHSPDIDVSYVDGYTVPITCSSKGVAITGCNIELFNQPGITCDDEMDGPICLNPARNVPDGPASCFFEACAGAAFTYPNDNEANADNFGSNLVSCCIGTSCMAPLRQGNTTTTCASTSSP